MKEWRNLQAAIAYASRTVDQNVSLKQLASKAHQSSFHAHRALHALLGETPKQLTLRLRLDLAAAALVTSQDSILEISLAFGFNNHETFCRAFRRRFQMAPGAYRKQGLSGNHGQAHSAFVGEIGPCAGLYHIDQRETFSQKAIRISMDYKITKQERAEQAVLIVRRKVRRAEIAATIAAELPKVFFHAQRYGVEIAGYPITRYVEMSMGFVTLETGMRVTGNDVQRTAAHGEGDIVTETLPGGLIATTVHAGPYDQLQNAYAALEEWIAASGFRARGAPWEAYLNDPGDHPDPSDWKTEVCWPISSD